MQTSIACLAQQGRSAIVLGQPSLWKADMSDAERKALWFVVNTPRGAVRASPAWLAQELQRYNQAQQQAAEAAGALYIPLDRAIPKTLDYFYDDCHFTDRGSQAVAEGLFPAVAMVVEQIVRERGRAETR